MSKTVLLALPFVAVAAFFARTHNTAAAESSTAADTQTQKIVTATTAFLNSLSIDQRAKVQFPFAPQKKAIAAKFARTGGPGGPGGSRPIGGLGGNPGMHPPTPGPFGQGPDNGGGQGRGPGSGFGGFVGEQYGRAIWSNFPVSDVPRPGLRLGSLSAAQRGAATHLLQVALSPNGYQKVLDIMGSDQALSKAGTPFCSGTACYTIGLFGEPSATKPWMLEFGGHHLALNITMAGEHGVITPALTGAQPAVYTSDGKTVRALAQENDKAFALLNALDQDQRKQAILNYRVGDLVLGPGHDGDTI